MTTSRRGLLNGLLGITASRISGFDPDREVAENPFSQRALGERAEALAEEARSMYPPADPRLAIGREIAASFRNGRCRYIPQFARMVRMDDQIYWSRRFYEIFPNGERLADLLVRLDNTDIESPKFKEDIDTLIRDYHIRANESPVPLMVTANAIVHNSDPLGLTRFAERLWTVVEATGREDPARAAVAHAQASGRYLAPSISRWLDAPGGLERRPMFSALVPLEIARYGALWTTVEDVVGPSAIEPLAIALSAGYVPLGRHDDHFVLARKTAGQAFVRAGAAG